MKRLIPALAIIGLALTGCASGNTDADTGEQSSLYERNIVLEDGREVTCIVYAIGYKGGLSCDWDKAR
ncbi:hypothetical protein [Glutamicibacter sp. FBE19]|uniref:hypothetical protein n=1 Tax=Glutamicibacter sp. FBE19 TaxID=2761534 RepID=UPI00189675C7|nr:hypothetical protein [Glutamicibacter sp. FBE19]MBF6671580.1 hypothetical protein [Glutamicibacter sp. FBE19]